MNRPQDNRPQDNRPQDNRPEENQEPEFWDWTEEELHRMMLQRRQDLEALAIILLFLVVIVLKLSPT